MNSVCSAVALRMWNGELGMLSATLIVCGVTVLMRGVNSVCSAVAVFVGDVTLRVGGVNSVLLRGASLRARVLMRTSLVSIDQYARLWLRS